MGKNDVCCVLNCKSRRSKCPGMFFSTVPMGKSKEQSGRRRRWIDLIRRKYFTPTVDSKVCRSSNMPNSVDYYPSKNLGYRSARDKETGRKMSRHSFRHVLKLRCFSNDSVSEGIFVRSLNSSRESELYPTSEFSIRFSAEHYHARHLAFSEIIIRSRYATMVRLCQYCSCNIDAEVLSKLRHRMILSPKYGFFQIRKKM